MFQMRWRPESDSFACDPQTLRRVLELSQVRQHISSAAGRDDRLAQQDLRGMRGPHDSGQSCGQETLQDVPGPHVSEQGQMGQKSTTKESPAQLIQSFYERGTTSLLMAKISLCVSSQTPLVRFNLSYGDLIKKYGRLSLPINLTNLAEGDDYEFNAGGVTRMVFPLLKRMLDTGILKSPQWVSLNSIGPETITTSGITFHHVQLEKERVKGYGLAKESIWQALHGIQKEGNLSPLLWQDEFIDYTYYNRSCSELALQLDKENDFDLFYIHDFQQLPMAHMMHAIKPKIFRWHIPFDESLVPDLWRHSLASYFNSYDVVIASCRRYLESLKRFGYKGKSSHIYPYIDQDTYKKPSQSEVGEFSHKFGIGEDDRVVLMVARLDPMKGQDRAIRGFAKIKKNFTDVKLVVAGNGSFSSSKRGIGLSKAERWLGKLRELVKALGVEDSVIFTGHLTHKELQAAYERCELTVLPSVLEGFGLVVVESWLYKKPAVVSLTAGVAELVKHEENGLLFNPDDSDDLANKFSTLLTNQNLASALGENGFITSRRCFLERGMKAEAKVMQDLVGY